tara:strand:- start:67 stop:225 length:159 start_codon:yes stop_codon:yes gene_type:complete
MKGKKQMQELRDKSDKLLEWNATYTLDKQILEARQRMGEKRWNELNSDWNEE